MARILSILIRIASASLRRGVDDIRAMYAARWQLAQLELSVAAGQVKRLGIVLALALVLAASSLTLLLAALALAIASWQEMHPTTAFLIVGGGSLLLGAALAILGWLGFRRRFVGLQDSIAECQEDLTMIREWVRQRDERA